LKADSTNSSSNVTALPKKEKKLNWKDIKVEAFMPLVESVESKILSSRLQLVIKVLSVNNYTSLIRCLSSLSKAKYGGDTVDIHIYIDHFETSKADRRRMFFADKGIDKIEVESAKETIQKVQEKSTSSTSKGRRKRKRSKLRETHDAHLLDENKPSDK
jgi:hypothetical protein